jgi:hypothetical protein
VFSLDELLIRACENNEMLWTNAEYIENELIQLIKRHDLGRRKIERMYPIQVVLENDDAGVIYSGIGVNGAKCSDYNKFPMFFEQLPALEADLVIISLGTNESFQKNFNSDKFYNEIDTLVTKLSITNPNKPQKIVAKVL